jgi:hypothetical protein
VRRGTVQYCRAARSQLPRTTLAGMTKWEYATVPLLVHATKQILDTWGQDGWELVQVVPGPNAENVVAYLKRAIEG